MNRFQAILVSTILIGSLAALTSAQPNLDSYKGCGLSGKVTSHCGEALNRLKNRYTSPTSDSINSAITLKAIVAPGDDVSRWKTSDAAQVTAFVASVEPGGVKESCNCGRSDLQDVHINLVASPSDVGHATKYVVAEITPRMQSLHPSWTLDWARGNLANHWVRFTGWMLLDGMHSRESFNTKEESQQKCGSLEVKEIWRATAWEIHPITGIEVVHAP
jgi:hypothetical protein